MTIEDKELELKHHQAVYAEMHKKTTDLTLLSSTNREEFLKQGGTYALEGFNKTMDYASERIDQLQHELTQLKQLKLFP